MARQRENLPEAVSQWLRANTTIVQVGREQLTENAKVVTWLYKYFSLHLRNPYTHQSKIEEVRQSYPVTVNDNRSAWVRIHSNFILDPDRPNQRWEFHCRAGLDIATILRLLVFSLGLQVMGIEVSQDVLEGYIAGLAKLDTAWGYINETRENSILLGRWCQQNWQDNELHMTKLSSQGLSQLKAHKTQTFLENLNRDVPSENRMRQFFLNHIKDIKDVNARINEINQVIGNPNFTERIEVFLTEMLSNEIYLRIFHIEATTEYLNTWSIIQDPCLN